MKNRLKGQKYWVTWLSCWKRDLKVLFARKSWIRVEQSKAPVKMTVTWQELCIMSNTSQHTQWLPWKLQLKREVKPWLKGILF